MCTDTIVGTRVHLLKDEIVAISYKPYRKSDIQIYWVNEEAFKKFRDFLISIQYFYENCFKPSHISQISEDYLTNDMLRKRK